MKFSITTIYIIFFLINSEVLLSQSNNGKDSTHTDIYYSLAQEYMELSKYDTAIHCFEKALKKYEKNKDRMKIVDCSNKLGECLIEVSEYDRAIKYLNKVKSIFDNNSQIGITHYLLGEVYLRKANYKEAILYYTKAQEIESENEHENYTINAKIYIGLGLSYKYMSKYDKALSYLKKALPLDSLKKKTDTEILVLIYNLLGSTYYMINDFDHAHIYFNTARSIQLIEMGEKNINSVSYYNNIGGIYSAKGNYNLAIEYYKKALLIAKEVMEPYNQQIAISYIKMGIAYKKMKKYEQAIMCNDSALNVLALKLGEKHRLAAMVFNNKGNIYFELNREFNNALENYNKALEIKKTLYGKNHPQISSSYHNIGELYAKNNNYKQALNYYQKAIHNNVIGFNDLDPYINPTLENVLDKKYLLISLLEKGSIFLKYYKSETFHVDELKAALNTFNLASDLLDDTRIDFEQVGSKLLLAKISYEIYKKGTECSLLLYRLTNEQKYKEQSFIFSEKNKVAVLYESITDAKAKKFSNVPDSLIIKENKLNKSMVSLDTKLKKYKLKKEENDSKKINDLEEQYFAHKINHQKLIQEIELKYPNYYQLKLQKDIVSISDLQKDFDNNSVLLEYLIADNSIFIYSISKDEFDVFEIKIDSLFNQVISRFNKNIKKRSLIKKSNKEQFIKDSHLLYSILIEPVKSRLNHKDKLIIIPEGLISFLPFESLIIFPKVDEDFNKQKYLITQYSISYHYSATLFHQNNQSKNLFTNESFVGFAPVFFDENHNNNIISTNRSFLDTLNTNYDLEAIVARGNKFLLLPESEKEIIDITDEFNKLNHSAKKYLRSEATEELLKSIKRCKFLHIATHGFFNEDNPEFSGIALSQPMDTLSEEDGILYSNEIYNLDIESDLIVLSSCESGSGKLINGEGIMAITRGFLYIGIPNIVYSLWKISDKNTNYLMVEFYRNILSGKPYAEALRNAKLKMINQKPMASPYYWSAFLQIGG